jgi:hypothetical protein
MDVHANVDVRRRHHAFECDSTSMAFCVSGKAIKCVSDYQIDADRQKPYSISFLQKWQKAKYVFCKIVHYGRRPK